MRAALFAMLSILTMACQPPPQSPKTALPKAEVETPRQPTEETESVPVEPEPVEPEGIEKGFVLLARNASIFRAPGEEGAPESSPRGGFGRFFGGKRHRLVRFQTTGVLNGDWVEIEQAKVLDSDQTGPTLHCHFPADWAGLYALKLYVPRGSLEPVLTRHIDLPLGKVGHIRSRAGTGLVRGDALGDYTLFVLHDDVTVVLPEDAVGRVYQTPTPQPAPSMSQTKTYTLARDLNLETSGGHINVPKNTDVIGPDALTGGPVDVTVSDVCSEVTGRGDVKASLGMLGLIGGGFMMRYSPQRTDGPVVVPKGTAIFWSDGTPAGTVLAEHKVGKLKEASDLGLRCLDGLVAGHTLCFKKDDLNMGSP